LHLAKAITLKKQNKTKTKKNKTKIKFIFRDQLKIAKNRKLKSKDESARLILLN